MSGFASVRFDFDLGATPVVVGKSSPGMVDGGLRESLELLAKSFQIDASHFSGRFGGSRVHRCLHDRCSINTSKVVMLHADLFDTATGSSAVFPLPCAVSWGACTSAPVAIYE